MTIPAEIQARLAQLKAPPPIDAPQEGPDLRWAHKIVARHQAGQSVKSATLQMARDALARRGGGR